VIALPFGLLFGINVPENWVGYASYWILCEMSLYNGTDERERVFGRVEYNLAKMYNRIKLGMCNEYVFYTPIFFIYRSRFLHLRQITKKLLNRIL
jgi:hypothetical protein